MGKQRLAALSHPSLPAFQQKKWDAFSKARMTNIEPEMTNFEVC